MRIIGIDPGNEISGICAIDGKKIVYAENIKSSGVFKAVKSLAAKQAVTVVIEDLAPYNSRLTPQIIDTAKYIGELTYRFNTCDFVSDLKLVPRNKVKMWIYDSCPDIAIPRIIKRMEYVHNRLMRQGKRGLVRRDGVMRLPSFNYVDDRIVIAALKELYSIPTPKPGKPNIYGLKEHSWQALGVCAVVAAQ